MHKLFFISFLAFTSWSASGQKYFPNSYYITLTGDTVKSTIVFTNIVEAQRGLKIVAGDKTVRSFSPDEIKGFCIVADKSANLFGWQRTESDAAEIMEISPYVLYSGKTESISTTASEPASWSFKSVRLSDRKKLFSLVRSGNKASLQELAYYYADSPADSAFRSATLIVKDDRLISWKKKNVRSLFSKSISDYTLLAKMVRKGKLDVWKKLKDPAFVYVDLVVREYNTWKQRPAGQKADTSQALKGILDADRFYKSRKAFFAAALPSCALIFPGLIVATVSLDHPPREKDLKIPNNCDICKTIPYLNGYKMRAGYKREKSIQNGLLTGGAIGVLVLLPLLILLNSK